MILSGGGSFLWQVYVRPGITTKENQQTVSPPFWFVCLPFHSTGELIHLSSLSLTRAVASWLLHSTPAFEPWPGTLWCVLGHDILVSPCLCPSLITHGVGSWLEAFLWLSIDHRLNDTISIDWYRSIDCFFPSIGHSGICFVRVPSFPTQCLSRSCITYVFEMVAVWATSSLYQHTSVGDGRFFRVTCW